MQLPNIGSGICFGLAWAVSPEAQKAHKADLELYCGEKSRIYEVHFASSAFCSAGGTCIGTPGSLKKFAAELKSAGEAVQGMDCLERLGQVHVAVRGLRPHERRDHVGQLPEVQEPGRDRPAVRREHGADLSRGAAAPESLTRRGHSSPHALAVFGHGVKPRPEACARSAVHICSSGVQCSAVPFVR